MLVQSFSGIRGVYGKDLTEETALKYSYLFNGFLKKKLGKEPLVAIGYDTRASNKALKKALFTSFLNIIDAGIVPVAALELAVREFKADGGIMITASHNEPEYNGFKFLDRDGAVLRPKDIHKLITDFNKISSLPKEGFLEKHPVDRSNEKKKIDEKNKEIIDMYALFLKKAIGKFSNKSRIIIDVNGGSGMILSRIIKKLGLSNIMVINDYGGRFIRKIEPNEESLRYLKGIIKKEGADFAAGLDCDADRAEILLDDGSLVDGNYLLALIADDILEKSSGTVVTNDATSNLVSVIAQKHNCDVKEVEVGEINVVDEMLRLDSPIGGEGSNGGVIIPPSRCRDGILSVLCLLKIINEKGRALKQLIGDLPEYYSLQEKIRFKGQADIKEIRGRIKGYYLDKRCLIKETGGMTGGLKALADGNSFVWFRFSKTEPGLLRVIADSCSEKESKRLLQEASSLLSSYR
ncbi:hypothetical protein KY366_06085 [Candidatus Woesearchaeota archaeon]|nr:hypothetical protein [Candidatus Woesearchaeota archaeon]